MRPTLYERYTLNNRTTVYNFTHNTAWQHNRVVNITSLPSLSASVPSFLSMAMSKATDPIAACKRAYVPVDACTIPYSDMYVNKYT